MATGTPLLNIRVLALSLLLSLFVFQAGSFSLNRETIEAWKDPNSLANKDCLSLCPYFKVRGRSFKDWKKWVKVQMGKDCYILIKASQMYYVKNFCIDTKFCRYEIGDRSWKTTYENIRLRKKHGFTNCKSKGKCFCIDGSKDCGWMRAAAFYGYRDKEQVVKSQSGACPPPGKSHLSHYGPVKVKIPFGYKTIRGCRCPPGTLQYYGDRCCKPCVGYERMDPTPGSCKCVHRKSLQDPQEKYFKYKPDTHPICDPPCKKKKPCECGPEVCENESCPAKVDCPLGGQACSLDQCPGKTSTPGFNIGNLILGNLPKTANQSLPASTNVPLNQRGAVVKGALRVYVDSFDDFKVCGKQGQCYKVCYSDGTNCPHKKK